MRPSLLLRHCPPSPITGCVNIKSRYSPRSLEPQVLALVFNAKGKGWHREATKMAKRETQYRGYKIEVERRGRDWRISASPTRPELPILHEHSFQALIPSWEGAVDEAKRRIDRILPT